MSTPTTAAACLHTLMQTHANVPTLADIPVPRPAPLWPVRDMQARATTQMRKVLQGRHEKAISRVPNSRQSDTSSLATPKQGAYARTRAQTHAHTHIGSKTSPGCSSSMEHFWKSWRKDRTGNVIGGILGRSNQKRHDDDLPVLRDVLMVYDAQQVSSKQKASSRHHRRFLRFQECHGRPGTRSEELSTQDMVSW